MFLATEAKSIRAEQVVPISLVTSGSINMGDLDGILNDIHLILPIPLILPSSQNLAFSDTLDSKDSFSFSVINGKNGYQNQQAQATQLVST